MKNPFKRKLARKRAHIQITGGPHGHAVKVLLDGEDISHLLRRVTFDASVDDVVLAQLEVVAAVVDVDVEGETQVKVV